MSASDVWTNVKHFAATIKADREAHPERYELLDIMRQQISWDLAAEEAMRKLADAILAAGYRKADTKTEWGVRRDADSAIYSEAAARETVARQRKRKLNTVLIKRQVGPWELAEP